MAISTIPGAGISTDTLEAGDIAAGAVGTSELAADAVTGAELADNAVNSEHYTDVSIDTAHLGNLQVTAAKVATDVATTAGTQTFTNKTLTAPTLTTPALGTPASGVVTNLSGVLPAAVTGGSGLTALGTVASGVIGSAVTGYTGIKNVDKWRIHTSSAGDAEPMVNYWERDLNYPALLGTGMTAPSSGIWAFPSTGYWLIMFDANFYHNADSRYCNASIEGTANNGTNWYYYSKRRTYLTTGTESGDHYTSCHNVVIFDCVSISTHKIKFSTAVSNNSITTEGGGTINYTIAQFIRLGDT